MVQTRLPEWEVQAVEQHAAFHRDWHDYWGSCTWQKLGGRVG
ncbi:hypothetical protein [Streptomyces sp. NPDC004830]